MAFYTLNYTRCLVIVHGKSEYCIVRHIYTNLHLPIKIVHKEKGSIQINGLLDYLKKSPFDSIKELADRYTVEYDNKTKKLKNFKIFIIMDTDDCDEVTKEKYINGTLFNGHLLKEYIVPIYNISNLEDVMLKANIMTKRINNSQKGTFYTKVFPINKKPISDDTVKDIKTFGEKIKDIKESNMYEFVKYCLEQLLNNQKEYS